jgi:hypothetical protein
MKKAMRNAMMILAGVSMMFAVAGNAAADEMISVGGVQVAAADFQAVKAQVAGQPAGDRVYANPAGAVNVGGVELAGADVDRVRAVVAGKASVSDAVVYAPASETVDLGPAAVEKADFEAVKAEVSGGPMFRLAQRIQDASAVN